MIYIFRDSYTSDSFCKIDAESINGAVLKVLNGMLKRGAITAKEICDNLDLELYDVNELEWYE